MLKIIAGQYRSRILESPPEEAGQRPYLARIKESVFNLLRGWFDDARVLDLFAGVGTVGLECVSRGAKTVLMVEMNTRTYKRLVANIEALGCGDRAIAMHGDALGQTALLRAPQPVDLVFVDPPFALMTDEESREKVFAQVAACAPIMARPSFAILRTPINPHETSHEIPGMIGPEIHHYGLENWVLLYQPESAETDDEDAPST